MQFDGTTDIKFIHKGEPYKGLSLIALYIPNGEKYRRLGVRNYESIEGRD